MTGDTMTAVHIYHGQNTVDLEERVDGARRDLDPDGYGTTTLDLADTSVAELRAAFSTPPFFGSKRVVVLRGIPGGERSGSISWRDIEPLLANLGDSTVAIIGTPQRIPSNRRLLKTAKQQGWIAATCDIPYGPALERWVAERAGRSGASIGRSAARLLLDHLYLTAWRREDRWNPQTIDTRMLATEIEKLAIASDFGEITDELVQALVVDRGGVTAFRLNDEAFDGRAHAALAELYNVLSSGEAPERVVGQVGYQPLVFMCARQVQAFGSEAVSDAAGVSAGQLNATVTRKAGWRRDAATRAALEKLRRAEWLVKTGRSADARMVLPALIGEIAGDFSGW